MLFQPSSLSNKDWNKRLWRQKRQFASARQLLAAAHVYRARFIQQHISQDVLCIWSNYDSSVQITNVIVVFSKRPVDSALERNRMDAITQLFLAAAIMAACHV